MIVNMDHVGSSGRLYLSCVMWHSPHKHRRMNYYDYCHAMHVVLLNPDQQWLHFPAQSAGLYAHKEDRKQLCKKRSNFWPSTIPQQSILLNTHNPSCMGI